MNRTARLRAPLEGLRTPASLLLVCALLLSAAAAVLLTAHSASADEKIGRLTLNTTTGAITDKPISAHVAADAACPAAQADRVRLMLVNPTTGAALTLGQSAVGDYSAAPVSADLSGLTFTLAARLNTWIPSGSQDGTYPLQLRCIDSENDAAPIVYFGLNLVVTGTTWKVAEAAATTLTLTADPAAHPAEGSEVTLTAAVTPADVPGEVTFTSTRSGQEPQVLGKQAVTGGTAVLKTTALPQAVQDLAATFTPADTEAYAPSTAIVAAFTVDPKPSPTPSTSNSPTPSGSPSPSDSPSPTEPADLDVTDADGNALSANPDLDPGEKVLITARGYTKDATVEVTLADSESSFEDAKADTEGTVTGYAFTVPEDITDGSHTLTLIESVTEGDAHSVDFAFTTGAETSESPSPSASDSASDLTGGTDTGGGTGGSGGDTGGTSGGDGSSGGGTGSMASTGAQAGALGLGALALVSAGAALVLHVRRKGLLTFADAADGPEHR